MLRRWVLRVSVWDFITLNSSISWFRLMQDPGALLGRCFQLLHYQVRSSCIVSAAPVLRQWCLEQDLFGLGSYVCIHKLRGGHSFPRE